MQTERQTDKRSGRLVGKKKFCGKQTDRKKENKKVRRQRSQASASYQASERARRRDKETAHAKLRTARKKREVEENLWRQIAYGRARVRRYMQPDFAYIHLHTRISWLCEIFPFFAPNLSPHRLVCMILISTSMLSFHLCSHPLTLFYHTSLSTTLESSLASVSLPLSRSRSLSLALSRSLSRSISPSLPPYLPTSLSLYLFCLPPSLSLSLSFSSVRARALSLSLYLSLSL